MASAEGRDGETLPFCQGEGWLLGRPAEVPGTGGMSSVLVSGVENPFVPENILRVVRVGEHPCLGTGNNHIHPSVAVGSWDCFHQQGKCLGQNGLQCRRQL